MQEIINKLEKIFKKVTFIENEETNDLEIEEKFLLFFDENLVGWATYITNKNDKVGCPILTKAQAEEFKQFLDILSKLGIKFVIDTDLVIE